jgi:uncharacterized OsmC-like protein/alpha-beta hydrolase superfamily lysophospholipase
MSRTEKITFTGALGDPLAARLDLPEAKPDAYALFAHCFTCTKDIFAASRIARGLTEHGIAVLRFDFTGLGASEGEFANTNFSSNVGDLVAAANHLRENFEAPAILIGHSLGGAAVLAAASDVPEAKAICTVGAPADPAHVAHHFEHARDEIEAEGQATVQMVGRPFTVKKQFLDDIAGQKLEAKIADMKKALLVFHSPTDQTVGVENAGLIFQAAKHPKSFVSLDGADHLLSRHEDAIYVANVIAAWAERYTEHKSSADELAGVPGAVVVEETGEGKFANSIMVNGKHAMHADEPPKYGGDDTGPTPYDLLLAGLGACKSMTMRMYAERKGIALKKVRVTLSHQKIHADDCAACETETGMVDDIAVSIEIEGDLDTETRQRLFEIADKCPVHRTLHGEINIKSELNSA